MLRIIITDDHPVVLKGLKEIISDGFDNVTIDVCSRGYELLNKISNNDYDIVLLDISLPDINGLEVLKEIKKKKTKTTRSYPEHVSRGDLCGPCLKEWRTGLPYKSKRTG